jgi:general secretion pathway protein G
MKQLLLSLIILIYSASSYSNDDRYKSVSIYLRILEGSVNMYTLQNSRRPSTDQGLEILLTPMMSDDMVAKEPYLIVLDDDPWGNPYEYEADGLDYKIWSVGPDGISGSEDDICVRKCR